RPPSSPPFPYTTLFRSVGRRIVGIEARRIEEIGRIHDAAAKELRPQIVHGSAGELEIACDVACQRGAIVLTGLRRVAIEDVQRRSEEHTSELQSPYDLV